MQQLLNICKQYASEHYLLYNSTKSYSLCFKPKGIKFDRPVFYLDKLAISNVTQCRYLGIMICEKNCDVDIKRQMRKFHANTNMLLRKFSKCSPDVKCHLFKIFCSNMYCSTMWFDSTNLLCHYIIWSLFGHTYLVMVARYSLIAIFYFILFVFNYHFS